MISMWEVFFSCYHVPTNTVAVKVLELTLGVWEKDTSVGCRIYSLKRVISGLILILDTWRPTCFIVQTTGFNRPAKFLILSKHCGYDNFELN